MPLFYVFLVLSLLSLGTAIPIQDRDEGLRTQSDSSWVYHSYQTYTYCSPSEALATPSNVFELQALILKALLLGKNVKAFGSRHSTTDIICTDGIPVAMSNFNAMKINWDGTATFGAGVNLEEANEFLMANGRAFTHVPSYAGISVVGAIGTGAHGSSLKHKSSLSEQVTKITFIDGTGLLRTITSSHWDMNHFRIHLGLLGIIIDVTMESVPLFKMRSERSLHPESILSDGSLLAMAESYDFLEAYWFPSKGHVVLDTGLYLGDVHTPGDNTVTRYTNMSEASAIALRGAFNAIHANRNVPGFIAMEDYALLSLYTTVKGRVPIFTEDYVTLNNPAVGYGHKLMSSGCTTCSWSHGENSFEFDDNSAGFPISELASIVESVKEILAKEPATFLFSGFDIRFHNSAQATLAMANGRKSVLVEFINPNTIDMNKPKSGLDAYQAIFQTMIEKHGGRPHWGKNGLYYHSKDVIARTRPSKNVAAFRTAMKTHDPFGVFHNKFAKRLLGVGNEMDVNPTYTHCALRDNCRCSKNSDCGDEQVCTEFPDSNGVQVYKVCKDLNTYTNKAVGAYDPYNLTSILVAIFT